MLNKIEDINNPNCLKNVKNFLSIINRLISEGYELIDGKMMLNGEESSPPMWLKEINK